MIVRAFHKTQVAKFGSIENMMEKYPIGGIFVPYWDFLYTPPREQVIPTIKNAIADYENASKYPMIVTEDFERGVGSIYNEFTNMPSEMALGAANQKDLAYKFGNAVAKESNSIGINWLLHPLVDLNMNPLQDLVIERAISDDATRAYPLLKSQIEGMSAQGVVATIKHFPGDGATIKNQHLITSANNLSIPEWKKTFGTIYQKMINNGTPCIMVGHIRFPAYQKETKNGVILPASLSEELMAGLLKKKMKFNGVIMSDALNMGGAAGYYENEIETSLAAFKAGVDMVLWPTLKFMDSLEVRIKRGDIPMSRLDDAVERIWGVREQYGLLKKKKNIFYAISEDENKTIQKDAQDIANNAVTLLTDKSKIPLKVSENKRIAIVNISHENRSNDLQFTQKLLQEKLEIAQSELDFDLKWVSGENLHLTLKFLGDTGEEKLTDIKKTMKNTCSQYDNFNIYYDHFDAFPSTDYPKVLFFGLNEDKNKLINLQNDLENELFKAGFEKEDREYTPHLTFARTRKKTDMRQLKYDYKDFLENQDLRILQKVDKVSLIESQLYKSGPVYKELFSINLK